MLKFYMLCDILHIWYIINVLGDFIDVFFITLQHMLTLYVFILLGFALKKHTYYVSCIYSMDVISL